MAASPAPRGISCHCAQSLGIASCLVSPCDLGPFQVPGGAWEPQELREVGIDTQNPSVAQLALCLRHLTPGPLPPQGGASGWGSLLLNVPVCDLGKSLLLLGQTCPDSVVLGSVWILSVVSQGEARGAGSVHWASEMRGPKTVSYPPTTKPHSMKISTFAS